ncbi:type I restriction endonuclease subunit R [Planctomycetota bacterium]
MADYSEDALVEKPTIELFSQLGWQTANCFYEVCGPNGALGRETTADVVLISRLRPVLEQLNPDLPAEAFEQAIEELTRDRSAMSMAAANREIYRLLKDGVKVNIPDPDGDGQTPETVQIIDWNEAANNDYFLASQFWVSGEMYKRRADLIGFVNGLPLVFIELKATHRRLENAYNHNLKDYKETIPQLFWYNAFIILSNGSKSKIGSVTSAWEHFNEWKKINSEGEEGIVSLETIIRGTCDPPKLLDIVENFILFMEAQGGLIKLAGKNHQYLGTNNAIEALEQIESNRGKLGVFWHTQGSGKSISMIFFAQKIFRKIAGNWTFVVVTDRKELDGQIYKNFASTGVVTEQEAQATSSANLRQLLSEDHRYIFTLIHKFREPEEVSTRSDIIVITDEAHRSQYDTLAMNMRMALPNAAFIAFTGTPLIIGEERTRQVFGNYISIYNFKQSVDDAATVPLYYENRIPELQLTNENLNEDMERLLEEAELDEEQEKKLEREFGREYHLITRDDRLEKVAEDIVAHFTGRGYRGKAMVICIDKATAVKMYDRAQKYWKKHLGDLKVEIDSATETEREDLEDKIRYMQETDMAVVVSQSQNEAEEIRAKGADIIPHRRRMVTEDLDTKFKDPDDPFRIVFVCAMWMTGFDVPCCSTIYLDKPMRNHTLMQTIARANRVFKDKVNGLIVDYVGVFRHLQKALAIYGSESGGGISEGETPVKDKAELVKLLKQAIDETTKFLSEQYVDPADIQNAEGFERVKLLDDAVDAIIVNDESKRKYLLLADNAQKLYKAVLPDPAANEFASICTLFKVIAQKIRSLIPIADISSVKEAIEDLLDESIASEGYIIQPGGQVVDLSNIDFEALKKKFAKSRKRIEAEKLRGSINSKLKKMIRLNRTRLDYLEKFQQMIDEYNAGSINVDEFFKQLVTFAQELNDEAKRGLAEQLSEEQLTVFDLLTKPDMKLTEADVQQVKKVAKELLAKLRREKIVLDWRKRQQSRAAVRLCMEEVLEGLPEVYTAELYQQKCDLVYQHIYDSYYGPGKDLYAA